MRLLCGSIRGTTGHGRKGGEDGITVTLWADELVDGIMLVFVSIFSVYMIFLLIDCFQT